MACRPGYDVENEQSTRRDGRARRAGGPGAGRPGQRRAGLDQPAALAYGLGFIPLAAERFDLVIPDERAASREVEALVKVLGSCWLLDQLASLPGYDPSPCGQHIASLPRQ